MQSLLLFSVNSMTDTFFYCYKAQPLSETQLLGKSYWKEDYNEPNEKQKDS